MPACPTCNRALTDAALCRCGTDVGLLLQISARADHLYNLALDACAQDEPGRALELLEGNALLALHDVEARVLQARLLIWLGGRAEGQGLICFIRGFNPAHPGLLNLEIGLSRVGTEGCNAIL